MGLLLCLCGAVATGQMAGADAGAGREEPGSLDELQPVPFDSATTARYRDAAVKLAAAVATGDAAAFRSLHTDSGWAQTDDWWRAMLADQKKSFGRIVRAVGPLRGVVRAASFGVGVPRDGVAILVLFEREAGASMSFVLDDAGKIVKSSLWVQRELAKASTEGAETLWEAPKKGVKR